MANTKLLIQQIASNPQLLHSIAPREFEEVIAEMLASFGWQVNLTPPTKDGGHDILAVSRDKTGLESTWVIVCKRYDTKHKITVDLVRSIYGVKAHMGASNALLVTTSSFTKDAVQFSASRYDLQLADYERVIGWIKQYEPTIEGELYLPKQSFYSCFISYSHKDEEFAERLYSRMREANLRVWYAPEEMRGGEKLHEQIFSAIQVHDKLLLVLSEHSLHSEWVTTEIRRARKAEQEENRRKLFPIRLVDFDAIRRWECFDADTGKDLAVELREYYIPDFSNWKDHRSFEKEFDRLLRDLKAEEKSKGADVDNRAVQLISEFEEIKANIVFSTLAPVIATELKRLKNFMHKHSSLLNRSDVGNFYKTWIVPFEINLEFGGSLDLKQAQYEQMKEQLAQIDLQSSPQNKS